LKDWDNGSRTFGVRAESISAGPIAKVVSLVVNLVKSESASPICGREEAAGRDC
jgi:hypothetical protein